MSDQEPGAPHPQLMLIINKLLANTQLDEGDLRRAGVLLDTQFVPSEAEVHAELVRRGYIKMSQLHTLSPTHLAQ